VLWVDGRLLAAGRPVLRADDSAWLEGRGVYTSARVEGGRARFAERHARRLARGARALGLGELAEERVLRALEELARAAFGEGPGVVRLQASRDAEGNLHLVGVPRALGPETDAWSAVVVRLPGAAGPAAAAGAKVASRLAQALATDAARAAGADEALLLDAAGRLLEGARTNAIVVDAAGRLATPPLELGAVAGVAREVLLERVPELVERVVLEPELRRAGEIVATNAVRGARPVVRLDGAPVGDGRPGPWARRLDAALGGD
jgi:branched-subunit amino acid aminotransferase/4-amino-4-deoxychorismate lyase